MSGSGFSESIRRGIERERARAVQALNHSMLGLFWDIGHALVEREAFRGPGERDRLARYLAEFYPGSPVFSRRNLAHMRKFALAFPNRRAALRRYGHLSWDRVLRMLEASRLARKSMRWNR